MEERKGREEERVHRWTGRLAVESEGERERHTKIRQPRETNFAHTIPSSAGGCCGNIKHVSTCD